MNITITLNHLGMFLGGLCAYLAFRKILQGGFVAKNGALYGLAIAAGISFALYILLLWACSSCPHFNHN